MRTPKILLFVAGLIGLLFVVNGRQSFVAPMPPIRLAQVDSPIKRAAVEPENESENPNPIRAIPATQSGTPLRGFLQRLTQEQHNVFEDAQVNIEKELASNPELLSNAGNLLKTTPISGADETEIQMRMRAIDILDAQLKSEHASASTKGKVVSIIVELLNTFPKEEKADSVKRVLLAEKAELLAALNSHNPGIALQAYEQIPNPVLKLKLKCSSI
ncbi:hypothetical protein WDW86_03625 [Bdellovibrionota bacterium FG-2]